MPNPDDGEAESDDAQEYLDLLREGTPEQQIWARNELAQVFEHRGLIDLAAEAYDGNVVAGVREPAVLERLADLYRRLGRTPIADALGAAAQAPPAPDAADSYLADLRDGGPEAQAIARFELGRIFEQRGMVDEAIACHESNVAAGVADPDVLDCLASLYRRRTPAPEPSTLGEPDADTEDDEPEPTTATIPDADDQIETVADPDKAVEPAPDASIEPTDVASTEPTEDAPTVEDEQIRHLRSVISTGNLQEQVAARVELARIYERRELLDDAAECYEANIQAGVRDPVLYRRLAEIYRQQGDVDLADEVVQEADRLAARRAARTHSPRARRVHGFERAPTQPMPALSDNTEPLPAAEPQPWPEIDFPQTSRQDSLSRYGRSFSDEAEQPWYSTTPAVIASLLLCGPFGLALVWMKADWSTRTRALVTAGWCVLFVVVAAVAAISARAIIGISDPSPVDTRPTPAPSIAELSPAPSPAASPGAGGGAVIQPPSPSPPTGSSGSGSQAPATTGQRLRVANTEGRGVNLREQSAANARSLKTLSEGTIVEVVGPDQSVDGRTWRNVRDPTGATGWVAAEFLAPV